MDNYFAGTLLKKGFRSLKSNFATFGLSSKVEKKFKLSSNGNSEKGAAEKEAEEEDVDEKVNEDVPAFNDEEDQVYLEGESFLTF